MTVKTGGPSALILATGLLVCLSGPPNAAAATERSSEKDKAESSGPQQHERKILKLRLAPQECHIRRTSLEKICALQIPQGRGKILHRKDH